LENVFMTVLCLMSDEIGDGVRRTQGWVSAEQGVHEAPHGGRRVAKSARRVLLAPPGGPTPRHSAPGVTLGDERADDHTIASIVLQ